MNLNVLNQSSAGGPAGGVALESIVADLRRSVRGQVRFGLHDRMLYSTDASMYQVAPLGVVVPADADDAMAAVRFCAERELPMLPRGGGTSLAGQCTSSGVVIDVSAGLRVVRMMEPPAGPGKDGACYAEAGVTPDELNAELARLNLGVFFAPDPATTAQATVGGCIGNNAAGSRSIKYGRTSENVLGIDAVLADGVRVRFEAGAGRDASGSGQRARALARGVIEIVKANERLIRERFPKTLRQNAGYGLDRVLRHMDAGADEGTLDLAQLLCGSEGTLAFTLGARLLLRPAPKVKGLVLLAFSALDRAIEAVTAILTTGPSAVELVDDVVIEAARGNIECSRYVDAFPKMEGRDPAAVLYVEYQEESEGALAERLRGLERVAPPGTPVRRVLDGPGMADAWKLRKAGEPLLHGLPGERKPITFVEDNAVPPERLAEFVRGFRAIVAREGTRAAFWAHASVGVLHVRPMLNPHDAGDLERLRRIAVEVADLARACGGVMSGEHGDGRVRGPLLERFYGPELMRAFGQVKALFDPRGLLNPGNIVSPGPIESITQQTRIEPKATPARVPETRTYFNYDDHHGFGGAIERCNGAGVCRKHTGGTMCPSFRATLDERHSTRGRGNALRLAITGQLNEHGGSEWSDPETLETLDLCLSCKACKSECPSNVDIARLKAEYVAQGLDANGRVPLQALMTGHVRRLNRLGSATRLLANTLGRHGPAAWVLRRVMGMHPAREIPRFSRSWYRAFARWRPAGGTAKSRPRVVMFADCFTTYNESRIGMSAVRLLDMLGYGVELPRAGCCGRSMISVGMLARAIRTADQTLGALRGAIEDPGVLGILFLEPSCLSAVKDDWLQLKMTAPIELRRRLAAKAMLVEQFVEARWAEHPVRITPRDGAGADVILHGHCHQKALWGVESSGAAVRRFAGARLQTPDTGCCGMAGAFGYDRERYDLSMKIGNLSNGGVLPIARGAPADAVVLAPGTSCRQQIRDGAGRAALHPVEYLERALAASL